MSLSAAAVAQPTIFADPRGDVAIRRTDTSCSGQMNPLNQRLPDIVEARIGKFDPANPQGDLFNGSWTNSGGFVRFDLVLVGLINPPGKLAFADEYAVWSPFLYGPNPICGWVEFDVDNDINTGAELSNPEYRFLGNAARFGGLPAVSSLLNRFALDDSAFDHNFSTPPQVERSGEEFHLVFRGEDIESITVITEKPNGDPAIFESGEVWVLHGRMWHRAHGFEPFTFQCPGFDGRYMPVVDVRFAHDPIADLTTISLVYPLTNVAAAATIDPSCPVEPDDGCPNNQNSIEEALDDLNFSATYADPADRILPDFEPIAEWEFAVVTQHLNPLNWRMDAVVGTAYASIQPDGARFIWTDTIPSPRVGDFDGNGVVDANDVALLLSFISQHDGDPAFDDDGVAGNGRILIHNFARNFSVFDTNGDGIVQASDAVVLGDMNIDLVVSAADVGHFVQALLSPAAYSATHAGADPLLRGDLNADGRIDGLDIAPFVALLLSRQ